MYLIILSLQLHRTVETLKLSTKKLNELERDLTEMEGTNDRLDRENRSLQKEVSYHLTTTFVSHSLTRHGEV